MSGELYDLLMGHEVGHALYTPVEGWHDAVNHRIVFGSFAPLDSNIWYEELIEFQGDSEGEPEPNGEEDLPENTFSDENEKEVFNSLNNEDYESEESEFNERQLEEFYSEDTILFEIPKPSKQYYEFLKETVERINSYDCGICIYNDIDEEYKLTNDSDVNDFVDAIDKMINHRYIDYDTSRLVDPDLYWSDTYLRKLDKHINKYGKSGEFVSYNQDINELLSQLNELKEITSVLRLCDCKLKGKRSRGMLRVNMWWMNRLLGEDLIRMKIKDDDCGENKKLVIGLNRMWVHMGNNMQCLMESWDSDQEIWSD
jgi:hypothetical protein